MSFSKRESSVVVNYGKKISFAGGYAGIAITSHGDWYWAVTAIMMASSFAFLGLSFTKPRHQRAFHYITALITMVASVAYFSMASNIGWTPTPVEFRRSNPDVAGKNRQIFYVRYIDWAITTPLLLMDLLLTAGLPWPIILFTVMLDEIMIVSGLVGALVHSSYKWGYYVFGLLSLFYIGYVLIFEARTNAYRIGRDVGKSFIICGAWTFFLWMLYPIAWAVAEGGNVIAPDSEAVFYGILDIMAKPVFGGLLLWGHKNIDPERLGMRIGSGNYFEDEAVEKQKEVKYKDDEAKRKDEETKRKGEEVKRKDIEASTSEKKKTEQSIDGTRNAQTADTRNVSAPVRSGRSTGASTRSAGGGGYSTPVGPRYARNDGTSSATYSTGGGPVYETKRDRVQREQLQQEQTQREQIERDRVQREQFQQEQTQREQIERDRVQREQFQQEQTQREQIERDQTKRASGGYTYAAGGQTVSAIQADAPMPVNRGMTSSSGPNYSTKSTGHRGAADVQNFTTDRESEQITGNSGFGLQDNRSGSGNYVTSSHATNAAQGMTTSSSNQGGQTTFYTREVYPTSGAVGTVTQDRQESSEGGLNASKYMSSSRQGHVNPQEENTRYSYREGQEKTGEGVTTSSYMTSSRQGHVNPQEENTRYSYREGQETTTGEGVTASNYKSSSRQGLGNPEEENIRYSYREGQETTGEGLSSSNYMSSSRPGATIPEEDTTTYTYSTDQGETGRTGETITRTTYASHPSAHIVRSRRSGGATDTMRISSANEDISGATGGFGINDGPGTFVTGTTDYRTEGGSANVSRNVSSAGGRAFSFEYGNRMGLPPGFAPGTSQSIRHETNPDGTITYYTTYAYTSGPSSPPR